MENTMEQDLILTPEPTDDNINADFKGVWDTKNYLYSISNWDRKDANPHALHHHKTYPGRCSPFSGKTNMIGNSPDNI